MEASILFVSDALQIEGLLSKGSADKGVVITHPHPLYGGDMHNPVVGSVAAAYAAAGYTTLRFNFRGTGRSEGRFSGGAGEQDDVAAAVDHLRQQGVGRIDLAGYSFGAWVNAGAGQQLTDVAGGVMVAPPVGFLDFSGLSPAPGTQLIVTGSDDDIAPVSAIRHWMADTGVNVPLEVVPGADHFFSGRLRQLAAVLRNHIG